MLSWACFSAQAFGQDEEGLRNEFEQKMKSIDWHKGPSTEKLGDMAEITLPEGYIFTATKGANTWLEMTQNLPDPSCLGIVMPKSLGWTLYFDFNEVGYVKDDEKDKIDANALLSGMKEGEKYANEERKKQGWPTLSVDGWAVSPHYDPKTNNLVWGVKLRHDQGVTINYDTRILGRHGVMSVTLVAEPENYQQILPEVEKLLQGFKYVEGQKYSQWEVGDKVAEYGLTGLIAGGAAFAAVKTGLFAKLFVIIAKMGKGIIIAVIAVFAWLAKLFTGRWKKSQ